MHIGHIDEFAGPLAFPTNLADQYTFLGKLANTLGSVVRNVEMFPGIDRHAKNKPEEHRITGRFVPNPKRFGECKYTIFGTSLAFTRMLALHTDIMITHAIITHILRGRSAQAVLVLAALLAMPATAFAVQIVVESEVPRDPDLVLADEPLVRIGMLDGPPEYLFGNVTGAIRLEDGSVVVADEQSYEVRMYDASGKHVWTSGQLGEGPGEYRGLRLLRGCPGAAITVYDWYLDRITELDPGGKVADTRSLGMIGVSPYGSPACTAEGGLVFAPWPDYESAWEGLNVTEGESYRWRMSLNWLRKDSAVTLRSGIPGTDRTFYGRGGDGPRTWGRDMVFAVAPAGVWYGSADDYELELIDWTGRVARMVRWSGPDLRVTREHVGKYRDARLARYNTSEERRHFERERWPDIRDRLPERFPAYAALLPLLDGSVWITTYGWQALQRALHLLDADGVWSRRLVIPAGSSLLDAGLDWVLLLQHDELGVPTVAVYRLIKSGTSSSSSTR